ncbi:MAG: NAD(P)H-hydrate dehydratase [Cyanobacteria bacterium P01_H01_bin.15]
MKLTSISRGISVCNHAVVNTAEMQKIEGWMFDAGIPVPALMEKVAGRCAERFCSDYPVDRYPKVGVLVGPGHNGGDSLVIARELHHRGYGVQVYRPLPKAKPLTLAHASYAKSLGIPFVDESILDSCQVIIDGLFGFGQGRLLTDELANFCDRVNQTSLPVVSIDLPSGIATDTGEVLGTAVQATQTYCLGLWKRAFFQDPALNYLGECVLIDFDIPSAAIYTALGETPSLQTLTHSDVLQGLPLPRPPVTHKYQQGSLLLICGSQRYAGSAILTALGARASGVGMLSIAVPESLRNLLVSQLPEALVIGCPETESGAIANLPDLDLAKYQTIVCGPGLTPENPALVASLLTVSGSLVLDADALNIVAANNHLSDLKKRENVTVLTPHLGEFKRLFPAINPCDRIQAAQEAAEFSNCIVLLKGARTAIASPNGSTRLIAESTPALARGGSGDVLAGLIGGLLCQPHQNSLTTVAIAAWWHAQTGRDLAQQRTELGADAQTLAHHLLLGLARLINADKS